jgi:hypothetical protein
MGGYTGGFENPKKQQLGPESLETIKAADAFRELKI